MSVAEEFSKPASVPALAPFPRGVPKRLVDVGLLHYEASVAGYAERYRRGETPQTVHVWWARRPHRAMRALSFACLCVEKNEEAFAGMLELTGESLPQPSLLDFARKSIQKGGKKPRLLDMFGGGGTIGYEAALLGAETYSIDSNELSVFIQRCILVYSQSGNVEGLASLVASSGERVLRQLEVKTKVLFPARGKVFGYFWTYSLACRECGYRFFLSKRPWVSKKRGKHIAFIVSDREVGQSVSLSNVGGDFSHESVWVGRNGTVECPKCSAQFSGVSVKEAKDELIGVAANGKPTGKAFAGDTDGTIPREEELDKFEAKLLKKMKVELPSSRLPRWSGIVNPALYGIETHGDFVNRRQRAVLLALIDCLRSEYEHLKKGVSEETAKAVVFLLSGLIDQLVDWNCRLSMWISQNEQVGRAFSGPGVAMLWDYAETDPVMNGPANLWKKLDRIVVGTRSIRGLGAEAHVEKAYAQELPFKSAFFDAIVTDPPYYDNIFYNVLADFFFAWKRLLFAEMEPDLFRAERTDDRRELVASRIRSGTAEQAHVDYCEQLEKAISEAERVLKTDGVFSLVYSHSSLRGWEAVVRAYRPTGLRITSVQPLSIERKARPRAMTSDAVNTCVVFVAHKAAARKRVVSLKELSQSLREHVRQLVANLKKAGWHNTDIGVAAYSQGVGMLCNVERVSGCEDVSEALRCFGAIVQESIPEFRVVERKSL